MKLLPTIFLCLFAALRLSATAQFPDILLHNGETYALHTNPLDVYFELHPEKNPLWPEPRDRYFKNPLHGSNTALWRGYIATFEIREKQLFVKDVFVDDDDAKHARLTAYMKNRKEGKPDNDDIWIPITTNIVAKIFPDEDVIKADWFTGTLVIPQGKLLEYIHMGYASTYEKYILIDVEEGNVVNERNVSHLEYRGREWVKRSHGYLAELWEPLSLFSKCLFMSLIFCVALLVVLRMRRARAGKSGRRPRGVV